jgi:transcriptional antiterminator Rof (Rho-off)
MAGEEIEDATWEEVDCLWQQFLNLDLKDKYRVQGGAIDRDSTRVTRDSIIILEW